MFGLSYLKLAAYGIGALLVTGVLWKTVDAIALEPRRDRDKAHQALHVAAQLLERTQADLKTAKTNAITLESKLAEQNSRWQDFADGCTKKADGADEAARGALKPAKPPPGLNHVDLNEWLERLLRS